MIDRQDFKSRVMLRLNRIERKCDLIISELLAQRELLSPRREAVDDAIDRLHEAARSLRKQSRKEKKYLRNRFGF